MSVEVLAIDRGTEKERKEERERERERKGRSEVDEGNRGGIELRAFDKTD